MEGLELVFTLPYSSGPLGLDALVQSRESERKVKGMVQAPILLFTLRDSSGSVGLAASLNCSTEQTVRQEGQGDGGSTDIAVHTVIQLRSIGFSSSMNCNTQQGITA